MNGNLLYASGQIICRIGTTLMFDLKASGVHNVPRAGGVLIVANHQSYLDPVCIGAQLPRPTSYFAKADLFKNPFFSALIRKLYAFPVRQGEGDIAAVREAIKRLQEGDALVVFPEGSRCDNGELLPLEPGVGLMVKRAGVPVVPCVIDGSYAAWPRSRKRFRLRPIRVRFGPPMKLANLKAHAIISTIDQTMHRMLGELRGEMDLKT